MLIDSPPSNHDHYGQCIYNDDQLTVFCTGCGQLWRARAWIDDHSIKRVEPYKPIGRLRFDGSEPPFMEEQCQR